MAWKYAVFGFFATVLLVNGVFIYLAVTGADEISPDYYNEANRR